MSAYKFSKDDPIYIGFFYEAPDGTIVKNHDWNTSDKVVEYFVEEDDQPRFIATEIWETWQRRADLHDFPGAVDPRMAYEFEILWGIKCRSDLIRLLTHGPENPDDGFDLDHLKAAMRRHNVVLTEAETKVLEAMD
jgi:hypothetical protein